MELIMGMNSGTSFDGIDCVLCEVEMDEDGHPKPPKFLFGDSYVDGFPDDIKQMVLDAFEDKVGMVGLTRLPYVVGAVFAEAARKFLKAHHVDPHDVKVLAIDGQTIYQEQPDHVGIRKMRDEGRDDDWIARWWQPGFPTKNTYGGPYPVGFQLGDTSVIAGLTDITTVTHFRCGDHVWGGNGAPLMQYFDYILFRHKDTSTLTLNIGGIANVHLANKDRNRMYAFDTGPGNVLVDHAARILYNQPCDYDGKIASKGIINEEMMTELMDHPFYKRPVPRSGWRNDFSSAYGDSILEKYKHLKNEDIMKTFCEYTARTIIRSIKENIPEKEWMQADVMYASGGGVKNPVIMECLRNNLPKEINLKLSSEIGVPTEYKEAIKFACLAYSTINNVANNIPHACHASQYTIMGKVSYAPWRARGTDELK